MHKIGLMLLVLLWLTACDTTPSPEKALKEAMAQAELDEAGLQHADAETKQRLGDVLVTREADQVRVRYGMAFDCSTHIYNAVLWAERRDDHILLCYSLLENDPKQDTQIYGACPQTLMLDYRFASIPQGITPPFKVQRDCPEAGMQSPAAM